MLLKSVRAWRAEGKKRPVARVAGALITGTMVLALALTGCTSKDSLAQQAQAGDQKQYIAGDGSVTEYQPGKRGNPVEFTGVDYDGGKVTAESMRGKVAVLNFWYAACAPCRAEAPSLTDLAKQFSGQGVQFYGVNVRDEKGTAEAFDRTFNITYPSLNDKGGQVLLGLSAFVPPAAVPTTIVLDKEGRVAARILGLADKSTLKSLIEGAQRQ